MPVDTLLSKITNLEVESGGRLPFRVYGDSFVMQSLVNWNTLEIGQHRQDVAVCSSPLSQPQAHGLASG